jgi:microcystin degradation protein MlrC
MNRPVRVAITGYAHEANAFAAPVRRRDGVDASQHPGGLAASWEAGAAVRRLTGGSVTEGRFAGRPVEVIDLPVWEFGASGLLDGDDFQTVVAEVVEALHAAAPVDAVLVLGHGAGRTTDDLDPDATFVEAVRATVGDDAPVVAVLDFHANLTQRLCDALDVVVGYRTNPHVDIEARLVEAADHVRRLLAGSARARLVWAPVPMMLPQIAQLTTPGEVFAEVMAVAEAEPPVRNVSVFGGFSLSDVPGAGMAVCASVDDGHEDLAREVVAAVCRAAWDRRHRYRLHTVTLDDAVTEAVRACAGDRRPVLLADTSDNPGGGAPATAPFILRSLVHAGATEVVMGLHCDARVVAAAWAAGVGASLDVEFNADSDDPLAPTFAARASVLSLVDEPLVPGRGVYAGSTRRPGRSCALQIDGIRIGVSSSPVQCADDDTLRHVGLDPAAATVVVVKSRGHFRAGFDHLFTDDQIIEVGAPGVATNDLWSVAWCHVERPVFPLDQIDDWEPQPRLAHRARRHEHV